MASPEIQETQASPVTQKPGFGARLNARLTGTAWRSIFRFMDLRLRLDRGFRRLIYRPAGSPGADGVPDDWRVSIVVTSRDEAFAVHALIGGGRVRHGKGRIAAPDLTLTFRDAATARSLLTRPPAEMLEMMLRSDLVFTGNMSHASRFGYLLSAMAPRKGPRPPVGPRRPFSLPAPKRSLASAPCDEVRHLDDPGLSELTIEDFPRLKRFLCDFFSTTPELCAERPRLYTEHFRRHGFELDAQGQPIPPVLRQAGAFHHLMSERKPLIREGDLLAGTTTA
jgi:hypothetical protein